MYEYRLTLTTTKSLGSMGILLDAVEDKLERLGFRDGEWEAEVHGPPELNIVTRDRL